MEKYSGVGVKQPKGCSFDVNGTVQTTKPFQLKKFFRLLYPPHARPKILNIDCDVIDISINGIRFAWNRRSYQSPESLTINDSVNLRIQFGDGEIDEMQVKILRCFEDTELGKTCFAGSILMGMPEYRIKKEQAYICQHSSVFHESQSSYGPAHLCATAVQC